MAKRTKTQLTKDAFVAYGDNAENSGDDDQEMDPPQHASEAVMAGRKIAGRGRRFGAKKPQVNEASAALSSAATDKVQLSQMRSLNANFLKSVNDGITKNPVADFTAICTKYLDYVSKVQDKKIEVKKMDVPKVDVKPESVKTEGKANPFAMFAPVNNNGNDPVVAKPNFGVDTKLGTPVENAQAPARLAIPEAAKVDEGSDDDDEDENTTKPITLEGPKFVLSELPKSKSYGFQFGKAPQKDEDDSEDEIEIKGPSFVSTATVSDSHFKFPPKADDKKDSKPGDAAPVAKPSTGFSFGNAASTSAKPAFSFNLPASSDKPAAETNKVSFNFGAASKPENDTKPAFSFGAAKSSTPSFSFGATTLPTTTTGNNTTAPVLNFGQKATPSSAFSFGSSSATTTESKPNTNTNSVFSFGKNADSSSNSSNPFNIGKTTAFGNSTSPVFNFSANTPSSSTSNEPSVTAKKTEDDENPDEVNEAESDTVKGNFAVVHLTEKVEVKTGEEEEESLYAKRSKITKFNFETNGYDPVGLGELKVLKNKATGKCRILVRSEGSSNVLLNVAILEGMKYELLGDKKSMLRIPSVNADGTLVTYVARVKTATDGEELLKAVQSCQ